MRTILSIIAAAAISAPLLAATGCASNGNEPYRLTGAQNLTPDQQQWVDQRSMDEKGHYNPTLHQQALHELSLANPGSGYSN